MLSVPSYLHYHPIFFARFRLLPRNIIPHDDLETKLSEAQNARLHKAIFENDIISTQVKAQDEVRD